MAQLPADILDKACVIAQLAEHNDPSLVAAMLAPWLREDAESFVQVTLALAQMADSHKFVKAGHAEYVRSKGQTSEAVKALERQYQRERKANNRAYERLREQAELNTPLNDEVAA